MKPTQNRASKLHGHDLLVAGFIRTSHKTIPTDISLEIKQFTPIFKPHHFILFDSTESKHLSFEFEILHKLFRFSDPRLTNLTHYQENLSWNSMLIPLKQLFSKHRDPAYIPLQGSFLSRYRVPPGIS